MPTLAPQTTPFYGGGQVLNPANVIKTSGAPSSKLTEDGIGTIAVDNAAANAYMLVSKSGGVDTWDLIAGSSAGLTSLTGDSGTATASGGSIKLAGTANEITTTAASHTVTLSLPSAITAPGSLTTTTSLAATTTVTGGTGVTATTGNVVATAGAVNAGTSMTATLGNITATNGNVVLGTAGNKLVIATGSNASVGTSGAMSGTPGAVTVATTASSATAKIFYARATAGGTLGNVSITAQDGTGFTLTSTGNETSTFNWWIINA
jgi:trimeric autotransporter adhesin